MSLKKISILCLALLVSIISPSYARQEKQVTCTGKVIDEQGRPITGAKVTLHEMAYDTASSSYRTKPAGQVETREDGTFSFRRSFPIKGYPYGQVVAEKEGLAIGPAAWDMRKDLELEIKLSQSMELAGVVVDENDKPIADAEVSIPMLIVGSTQDQRGLTGPLALEMFTTSTDMAGKFRFTGLPADATAEFFVKKPGRATVSTFRPSISLDRKLKFAAGRTDIKLVSPLEAKIEGIVVEKKTGKPIGGVQIRCTNGREIGYFAPKPLVSKQDGTFSIDDLAPERYVLKLVQPRDKLPDWIAEPIELTMEAGKTLSGVKVELSKGGILEVVVKDPDSKQPVEKAGVRLQHEASRRYIIGSSGKDGVARMRLPAGKYQIVYLYKKGYSRQNIHDPITIEEDQTERLEYDLIGAPKITGFVRDEKGMPVKGAKLRICPSGGDEAISDAEGKFKTTRDLRGWASGQRPVMFLVGRYEKGNLATAVQMDEDARVFEVTLEPGVILSGKVVDPNGKGIARAGVMLKLRGPGWDSFIGPDTIDSDAQGRFEIEAVPADQSYNIHTTAEGYGQNQFAKINARDAVNGRLDIGNIELDVANLSVSGVVVDSNDRLVAGARISSYGYNQPYGDARTDNEGKFTLEKVCAGRIGITAGKAGTPRLQGSIETEGGATDVKIVITQRLSSRTYEPRSVPSLVGRPLRDLKAIGIQEDIDGKKVLVCFWDMQQRPSRHCLMQLAKQAETLKDKGVIVIAVQASKMDQNTLDEWAKKYNIPFIIGMVQEDEETTRFVWGVRSLPWLILTDKDHVIVSQGFSLGDLDNQLGQGSP